MSWVIFRLFKIRLHLVNKNKNKKDISVMIIRKIIILLLVCLFSSIGNASIEVTTTGTGLDKENAIKEALRSAIEQSVGISLESKQITEDSETIKLRIVASSQGFIQRYSILSEGQDEFGYTVEIHAFINDAKLGQDIAELVNNKKGMRLWQQEHFSNRKVMVIQKNKQLGITDSRLDKAHEIARIKVESAFLNKGIRIFDEEQISDIIKDIHKGNDQLSDVDWSKLARKHGADTLVLLSDEVRLNTVNLESMNVNDMGISKISYGLNSKMLETSTARLLARASSHTNSVFSGASNLPNQLRDIVNKTATDVSFSLLVGMVNSSDALNEVLIVFNGFSEDEKYAILDSVENMGFADGKDYREQEFSEDILKLEFFSPSFHVKKFRRSLYKQLKKIDIAFVTQECISSRCVLKKKNIAD